MLEPGRTLTWSWHYDEMAEYLWLARESLLRQQFPDVAGIIWNVPPRTAKSTFLTICYPVWTWTKYPDRRFLCTSFNAGLSSDHSVKRRDLMASEWFQRRWGHVFAFKADQNLKTQYANDKTGEMISTSVSGMTGKGGDTVIIDDPVDPEKAASDTERQTANERIDDTAQTRINDPSAGLIMMVMQRVHEMDPTGHLLKQDPARWIQVKVQLEATEDKRVVFPKSGRVVERRSGDVLMPERYPARVLAALKIRRLVYAGQYQQEPAPLEGNMVRRSEIQYYGGEFDGKADRQLPKEFDRVLITVDAAFKDLNTSDYVAVGAIGVSGPDRFILNLTNAHLDLPATIRETLRQREEWGADTTLIEDKANGPAAIKALRLKVAGVIAINPEGNKISRVFAMSGEWQAGNWYVDRTAAWTEPFIAQLCNFPNAAHDDMVDAVSQAAVYLQKNPMYGGFMEVWKEDAAKIAGSETKDLGQAQKDAADEWTKPEPREEAVPVKELPVCTSCGNKNPQVFQDGWICGLCGARGSLE